MPDALPVPLEPWRVLDLLSALVDKNLVFYGDAPGGGGAAHGEVAGGPGGNGSRYRLLETVRDYGRDRLLESGEAEAVRVRHRDYYLRQVEGLRPGDDFAAYRSWCEAERDNLRGALAFSAGWRENGGAPAEAAALRLATALFPFWLSTHDFAEGRAWLESALAEDDRGAGAASRERMLALHAAGFLAMQQGDYPAAEALAHASLEIARRRGEGAWRAQPLVVLGHVAGDPERAREYGEERVALLREGAGGNDALLADALSDLALTRMMRGEMAAARPLLEEATEAAERSGLAHALNYARGRVALLERFAGDYARASSLYEEHLAASREQNDLPAAAFTLRDLGALRVLQGNPAAAREYLEEATALFRRLGNRLGLIRCLEGMAQLAGASGAPARAVRLFGAAERQREVDRLPLPPVDRADYAALPGLRDALGEEAFSAAREEGRAMGLERATAYALGETGHGCC